MSKQDKSWKNKIEDTVHTLLHSSDELPKFLLKALLEEVFTEHGHDHQYESGAMKYAMASGILTASSYDGLGLTATRNRVTMTTTGKVTWEKSL
jgi:hypothetical protein